MYVYVYAGTEVWQCLTHLFFSQLFRKSRVSRDARHVAGDQIWIPDAIRSPPQWVETYFPDRPNSRSIMACVAPNMEGGSVNVGWSVLPSSPDCRWVLPSWEPNWWWRGTAGRGSRAIGWKSQAPRYKAIICERLQIYQIFVVLLKLLGGCCRGGKLRNDEFGIFWGCYEPGFVCLVGSIFLL